MKHQIFIVILLSALIVQLSFSFGQALARPNTVPDNEPPTITKVNPGGETTNEDTAIEDIEFTVDDFESDGGDLVVTAVSDNQILVPNANISVSFAGNLNTRTVDITPAADQYGDVVITVIVSDEQLESNTQFTLTVNPVNDEPAITKVSPGSEETSENTSTGAIAFTVADLDTAVASLIVTAVSDEPTLVPNGNITTGGTGANRTINILPATNQTGNTNITVTVDDGDKTADTIFQLKVIPNSPPTITKVNPGAEMTNEDIATGLIEFTVGDLETPGNLTVTAVADDLMLVPSITTGGTGANRTINILPGANKSGNTIVTVTVSDGNDSANTSFQLIVHPVNDPPTITPISPQGTPEDTTTNPIPFTISDIDTDVSSLTVIAVSNNQPLVPNGNIAITPASGASRSITITPAANRVGTATITVNVSDGEFTTPTSFVLTVSQVNDPPTISLIADQATDEDVETGQIPFTVGDSETPASQLVVTAVSSNIALVPNSPSNIILGTLNGTGITRTINLISLPNASGTATINVTVKDGSLVTAQTSFLLTVNAINDAPVIDLNGPGAGTGFAATYATNGNPVNLTATDLIVNDIDSPDLHSAAVTIINQLDGAAETLSVNTSGTSINSSYSGGVLTLSGVDSATNYRSVLRTVTYKNSTLNPTLTNRNIDFVVKDEMLSSVSALTVVSILNPYLELEMTDSTQTIPNGGTAVFAIKVKNTGNANLTNVVVNDPLAPDCNEPIGSLAAGATKEYTCNRTNVTSDFTNEATVTGRDQLNGTVTAVATARVDVVNPNITLILSPSSQTINHDGNAEFNVFVKNPSTVVDLVNVEVTDPLAPNCNKTIGNLNRGQTFDYNCSVANVETAFTNVATVIGENLHSGATVQDSAVSEVEVLDLKVTLEATPTELMAPGGLVTFTVSIENLGSLDFDLSELTSTPFGDLTELANSQVQNNDCLLLPESIKSEESETCSFTAVINDSPGEHDYSITAVGKDDATNSITANDTTTITIEDVAGMNVTLSSTPSSLPAPGGPVSFTVRINNTSYSMDIDVESLTDSRLGDLDGVGDCEMPQRIAPQSSYSCTYEVTIFGSIGESHNRSVTAVGSNVSGGDVSDSMQISVQFTNPSISTLLMPLVVNNYTQPDEPNNSACEAFPISLNKNYTFKPNDPSDWYVFDMPASSNIEVRLSNFVPEVGQLAVWTGNSCESLTDLKGFNGNFKPTKIVSINNLAPGRYYVWVVNSDNEIYDAQYSLRLSVP